MSCSINIDGWMEMYDVREKSSKGEGKKSGRERKGACKKLWV